MSSRRSEVVLVLGAGRGRRMGTPKALMAVAGVPWWERQVEAIRRAGRESVWVVSETVRDAIGAGLEFRGTVVTGDPDAPMFESFLHGIDAIASRGPSVVFVLPVDVPLADGRVLDVLGAAGDVVVPCFDGAHGHPISLRWAWLRDALADRSVERLDELTSGDRTLVEVDDPRVAMNLNRPADVRAFEIWLENNGR